MINKLRVLALLLAISIMGFAVYSFLSKLETNSKNLDFRLSKENTNIEIKKFKVIHESLGRKQWELKADTAEINQRNETTKLNNVEYIYINEDNREFKVYADFGILKNKTNDLSLEGHVKMVIESAIIKDRIKNVPTSKPQPKL